jgi:acetyl esterase/lipase
MNKSFVLAIILMAAGTAIKAQQVIPLYDGAIPNSKQSVSYKENIRTDGGRQFIDKVTIPTLTVYLPAKAKANGTSVIILPGGGYQTLAVSHEGAEIAKEFNKYGITAFLLKYRLPSDEIMVDKTVGPLQDAQRAIQLVRERAKTWTLDTAKIGILGSSAGGHLASTAGTHFQKALIGNSTNVSLRPNFMVLLYPVISFGQLAHTGSAKNLLGANPSANNIDLYSNETQVTSATPPTFLLHASDDKVVLVKNSILFYEALLAKGVPAEMHLYQNGGHGFGLHNTTTTDEWFGRLLNWMKVQGLVNN